MSSMDKITAAKQAFEAYERAVKAAQEVIAAGPPRGLGTTVMMDELHGFIEVFTCSECKGRGQKDWKFCAFCGAEIVRFDHREQPDTINVQMLREEVPSKPYTLKLKIEKAKS